MALAKQYGMIAHPMAIAAPAACWGAPFAEIRQKRKSTAPIRQLIMVKIQNNFIWYHLL